MYMYVYCWRAKRTRKKYNNKIKPLVETPPHSPTHQTFTQDPTSDKSHITLLLVKCLLITDDIMFFFMIEYYISGVSFGLDIIQVYIFNNTK